MAGHSKWANTKHQKDRADKKKGKIFSRITKEIISAVRQGGPDQKGNPKLRMAVQKAKDANMPKDNVDRNIKKASSADQKDYFEMTYEFYGYGGVGILVEIMTDNKNRISSDMHIATKEHGGNVAKQGAVSHNFDQKGEFRLPKSAMGEDDLLALVLDGGGEDLIVETDQYIVRTSKEDFINVKEILEKASLKCDESGLVMLPRVLVTVNEEDMDNNIGLIEYLEDLEDVDTVYHNMVVLV
jgi:YebC/PmpR family DNA-binding regulatory protein